MGVRVSITKDRRMAGGNSFFFLDYVSLDWWSLTLFGLQYYVCLLLRHKI